MDYYNEFDKYPAAWLRNLQAAGHLPEGRVDDRSIVDVEPGDLEGVKQAHFFAGIGGWPLALKLAGWPEDEEVWTGSCPCQPFSVAGKKKGTKDKRHLWPTWFRLIAKSIPPVIFGEQVASPDGLEWFLGVRADLEVLGYAVAASDLCAASISAPQKRQRIFWVASSNPAGRQLFCSRNDNDRSNASRNNIDRCGEVGRMARTSGRGSENGQVQRGGKYGLSEKNGSSRRWKDREVRVEEVQVGRLGSAHDEGLQGNQLEVLQAAWRREQRRAASKSSPSPRYWDAFDVLPCADGKARRIEPGTFPLAHGVPARVGKLRAYGNAIVPQVAAVFVRAYLETVAQKR